MYKEPIEDEQEHLIKNAPSCWERTFYNTKFQIVLVLILCAFIGIGTPFIWQLIWSITQNCCRIESDLRYDCFPLQDMLTKNQSFCEKTAHCCWDNDTAPDQIQCYYGMVTKDVSTKMPGYKIFNFTEEAGSLKEAVLEVDKVPRFIDINNKNRTVGAVVRHYLKVTVNHFSSDHFRVKISSLYPKDENDLENGYDLESEFDLASKLSNESSKSNGEISWVSRSNSSIFSLSVRRKNSPHMIFNTGDFSPFIYARGFIEITTLLPNDLIYGLGQSPSKGFKHNMTYPEDWKIFNQYNLNLTTNQSSWFGSHPFYMGWTNDDKAYGVLLLNSYPLQLITNSRPSLTFRTIGGPLDFHFFLGPTPADVNRQLLNLIGYPSIPPYWALGYHMCRTNDLNDPDTGGETIVRQMRSLRIPFDSDCGSASLSTTLQKSKPSEEGPQSQLNTYFNVLKNVSAVPLLVQVPHKTQWSQKVLANGIDGKNYSGLFFDWPAMDSGKKYPNISVTYPSFEDTPEERGALLAEYERFGDIEGTFLDYNTPLDLTSTRGGNMSDHCPYIKDILWNQYYYWKLNKYNPCLDSVMNSSVDPLSTHNLYGHRHMKVVKKALEPKTTKSQKRKLVMSLSTFIGDGVYGGHIGTNMNATWDMLRQTHIQTLEFNMYGIPLVGFPVCGFKGKSSDEELCLRWYQLAALQPFMISHRGFGQSLTDPYSIITPLTTSDATSDSTRQALNSTIRIRYRLLPYLFTLFHKAHTNGDPVIRPLFYDFPGDKKTFRIDKQYLIGSALLSSPVLHRKVHSVEAYFPKDSIWYDYYSGQRVAAKEGTKFNLSAIEYHINLHLRGGHVIPTQSPGDNTKESRKNPYELIGALDLNRRAEGDLYIDDGMNDPSYMKIKFIVEANNLTIIKTNDSTLSMSANRESGESSPRIDLIKIYGVIDPLESDHFNVTSSIRANEGSSNTVTHNNSYYIHAPYDGVLILRKLAITFEKYDEFFISWNYPDWIKIGETIRERPLK